jgi:predicted transcriptional regulator
VINKIAQASAFILLLVGSFAFGLLSKPTEMGLCILAAAIALAFSNIEKIKRFKGAGFEAEMLEKQVEAMIAKEAEPEAKEEQSTFRATGYGLGEQTRLVVQALGNSKYTWRTISGISQESGQSSASVKKAINWLVMNDLVVQAGTAKSTNWGLSEEGRKLYNSIRASEGAV